jgi:hypothetical protein
MEPVKRIKYSKRLEPDEIQEIMMEEESDEELEEIHDSIDRHDNVSSSSSEEEEEEDDDNEDLELQFRVRRPGDSAKILDFSGPPNGVNRTAASDINAASSPLSIFILFFQQIFQILLEESNRYFRQFLATQNNPGPSVQPPDITMEDLYKFLAIIIQMGHDQRDSMKDYWSREEEYHTPFFHNALVHDRFFSHFQISPF